MKEKIEIYTLPLLPLRGLVIYPKMIVHLDVGRRNSIKAINRAMKTDQLIFVTAQKDPAIDEPLLDDLFSFGVVAKVVQVLKETEDTLRVVLQGLFRAEISSDELIANTQISNTISVTKVFEKKFVSTARSEAALRSLKVTFEKYIDVVPKLPKDVVTKIDLNSDPGVLADYVCSNVFLELFVKQTILESIDPVTRLEILVSALQNEIFILKIEHDILTKAKENIDKNQREYLLREQKRVIEEELGDDQGLNEIEQFRNKIDEINFKPEVREKLYKECKRLEKTAFGNAEGAMLSTYLDTVLDLPWDVSTDSEINLDTVRKQLDSDHYGMNKVKDRIIESLAVNILNPNAKGNIICLVGPPGTGKTSIAISIAKSIGRNNARISLGGVKDEAEIRGHRKTYIGAMPGRIINAIKQANSNNPLLILDEIDKLSNDYKGDPTSALLEVLDPEQNAEFVDHYLDIPFDLSKTMFITTANDYDMIPAPLRDRMDVIELSSYTRIEKFHIAKKHLIPKQLIENGLKKKQFKMTDKAIYAVIDGYTREAGVRNLERTIATLMRKSAVNIINNDIDLIKITDKDIETYLGPIKFIDDDSSKKDEIGLVNGLAWTAVGGTLLPIECVVMPGSGKLELTGSLGDVMQESAKTALSCIRTRSNVYDINSDFYKEFDIHVHAPDGATPKDGPSAGITMALAMYSALTSSPIRHDFAMTGEITLRGKVMPIGGLREKAMAAYKAKVKNVIIPKENERDLSDIEDEIKSKINFISVTDFDEVVSHAIIKPKHVTKRETSNLLFSSKKGKRIGIRQ